MSIVIYKYFNTRFLILFADTLIVSAAFLLMIWLKPGTLHYYLPNYSDPFLLFLALWIIMSWWFDKFRIKDEGTPVTYSEVARLILRINIYILAIVAIAMYVFSLFNWSRIVVLGTIAISTMLELFTGYIFYYLLYPLHMPDDISDNSQDALLIYQHDGTTDVQAEDAVPTQILTPVDLSVFPADLKSIVLEETSENAFSFITRYFFPEPSKNLIVSTNTRFNIINQPKNDYKVIINITRLNTIRWLNKFFEAVNSRMEKGGIFICCLETRSIRKNRILNRFPPVLNYIIYTFDFLFHRVLPKLSFTKAFYFFLTGGNKRVLPGPETMGRLYSCGFQIIEESVIDNLKYFVTRKTCNPVFDQHPTYAPLITLQRVGKNAKIIKVYKFRTMYAYSEYLQAYVFEKNKLSEGGKFSDDFRITTLGKTMRMLWIDELPMLMNVLKGELKLVGVRPLSRHYYSLYTKELQEKRVLYKPGLIPPYYADFPTPKSLGQIMANELRYLEAYEKHHFITDFVYFWKAIYNIIFRRARSA